MNPEKIQDYNPNQLIVRASTQDGIYAGRLLMKNEVLRILGNMNQTKAMQRAIATIKEIEVDPYASDSVR